jgi:hypothetical protein
VVEPSDVPGPTAGTALALADLGPSASGLPASVSGPTSQRMPAWLADLDRLMTAGLMRVDTPLTASPSDDSGSAEGDASLDPEADSILDGIEM